MGEKDGGGDYDGWSRSSSGPENSHVTTKVRKRITKSTDSAELASCSRIAATNTNSDK